MIINLKRENLPLGKFQYIALQNSKEIGRADFNSGKKGQISANIYFSMKNFEMSISTFFGKGTKENGIDIREAATYSDGEEVNHIYYCGKKGSNFFNGIYYWATNYHDETYEIYEVGHGRKGIYFCIWNRGKIAAIISKDTHTKHFESIYTIFAENEMSLELMVIVSLFWDITRYFPSSSSEEWHTLNTWQKELKNRYDPAFIPRIKEMER